MAYVPRYKNDVFVSYAHVDNIPLSGISKGWVETLERVEAAIAEEQQLFWPFQAKSGASQPAPKPSEEPYELSLPDI